MPFIPVLPGVDTFKGQQMHSHDYRVPSIFKGKRVLVIGAGPSGMDLTLEISREAASASKQTRWFPDVIGSPAHRTRVTRRTLAYDVTASQVFSDRFKSKRATNYTSYFPGRHEPPLAGAYKHTVPRKRSHDI